VNRPTRSTKSAWQKLWMMTAMLAAMVSLPALSQAGVHQIWDQAHLFQVDTLDGVNATLAQIRERFDKDLMIETFPSIPDDFKQHYTDDDREKFYEGWAVSEARSLGVNGLLILITGQPRHLHIVVGYDTRKVGFTLADRDELVARLTNAFRAKQFDAGMKDAAQFVLDRMTRNYAAAKAQPATRPAASPATRPANEGPGSF